MGNVNDVIVPDFVRIKIKDKIYDIGTLSIGQVIKLTRHIAKFATKISSETVKELKESKSNVDDILAFFDGIDKDEVLEVIGIIIREKDLEFLSENLNIENTTEIVAAVCEKTDLKKILGNVKRIAEAVKK